MVERALVVGKFVPPHLGHHLCVDIAGSVAKNTTVVVCDEPGQVPSGDMRARWMAQVHPDVDVVVITDTGALCHHSLSVPCAPECSSRWAAAVADVTGPVDVVCSSEGYGALFATELGAQHVVVDAQRRQVPVSGTAVRSDLAGNWKFLHPVVRAGLVRKVVVLGAESTGTTTLSKDLADALAAPWVREAGRDVSAELAAKAGSIHQVRWNGRHFDEVVARQHSYEQAGVESVVGEGPGRFGPLIVCDTDVAATSVWRHRYLGSYDRALEEMARRDLPVLYVLADHRGVAFDDDGLRDGEHLRAAMTGQFEELLERLGARSVKVSGSRTQRLRQTLEALEAAVEEVPLFNLGERS